MDAPDATVIVSQNELTKTEVRELMIIKVNN